MALCTGKLVLPCLASEHCRARRTRARVTAATVSCLGSERSSAGDASQSQSTALRTGRRISLAFSAGALLSVTGLPQRAGALDLFGKPETGVPKAYVQDTRDLVNTLRESVMFEAAEAGERNFEREFRRKAEPAEKNVKKWIANWKGNNNVVTEASYAGIVDALQALGKFYRENGSRAPLSADTRNTVLDALDKAEAGLAQLSSS